MRGAAVAALALALVGEPARADKVSEALALIDRGMALYKANDLPAARATFAAAQQLVPDKPNPYRWLGLTDVRLRRCNEAVEELNKFLSMVSADDPRSVEAVALRDACKAELTPRAAPASPESDAELAARVRRAVDAEEQARRKQEERAVEEERSRRAAARLAQEAALRAVEASPDYQRDKVSLCERGKTFVFCDARGALTENAFIRRYQKVTGEHDLDPSLRVRDKKALTAMAVLSGAGLGAAAVGIAFLVRGPGGGDNPATYNQNEGAGLGVSVGGFALTTAFCIAFAARPDGFATNHFLDREGAQRAVERYDAALRKRVASTAR